MPSKTSRSKETRAAVESPPRTFYHLHSLLHTIHTIERYEDQLCALMHEIQTSGSVSAVVSDELRELLADIPSHEYQDELNAIRESLVPAAPARTRPKRAAKAAKAVAKKSSTAKGSIGKRRY